MKEVELIIFDLDGTLIDSRKDIANSVNLMLERLGLSRKSDDEITEYIGTGVEDLISKSLGKENESAFEEARNIFRECFSEHALDNTVLFPGVRDVLEHFSHKREAVVTNRNTGSAEKVLDTLGIKGYFDRIYGGDDTECRKPSSCPLDRTILELDVCDKKKAVMVGDMDIDVMAGRTAGILTCAVTYGIGKKEDIVKSGPDFMIDRMEELKGVIR